MYTSGSTGQPKAVIHTHRTILAQAKNSVVSHQLTSSDRSLLVLPLYHYQRRMCHLDSRLVEWWLRRRAASLRRQRILGLDGRTPLHLVGVGADYHIATSGLERSCGGQSRCRLQAHPLPALVFGPAFAVAAPEFLDKFKLPLIQAMGSTEAGIIFSNPVPPGTNKVGSLGQPWGFEVRIVNGEGADLPPGEPGEILLRGSAITPGYYKDPVTTAAVLDADNWLHTGDIAYRDQEGYFFVVGRSRELIIKGGMNIAPKADR